jgi:hypothetical protein
MHSGRQLVDLTTPALAGAGRVHREQQNVLAHQVALDVAHHATLERQERDKKIQLREAEKREAMQMQRLAFNLKHKEKLRRITHTQVEKALSLDKLAMETELKIQASDMARRKRTVAQQARAAEENTRRCEAQTKSRAARKVVEAAQLQVGPDLSDFETDKALHPCDLISIALAQARATIMDSKLREVDLRLGLRAEAQQEEAEARRELGQQMEQQRIESVMMQNSLREQSALADMSAAEFKTQRVEAVAIRKAEMDMARAEASRERFTKKKARAERRMQAAAFEQHLAAERSDAKMAKTDLLLYVIHTTSPQ